MCARNSYAKLSARDAGVRVETFVRNLVHQFEKPFPGWVKAMVACVMCVWLALVLWVWRNPGWVWGGGKLYFRYVSGGGAAAAAAAA